MGGDRQTRARKYNGPFFYLRSLKSCPSTPIVSHILKYTYVSMIIVLKTNNAHSAYTTWRQKTTYEQQFTTVLIFQPRILIRSQKVVFTLCSNPSASGGVIVQSVVGRGGVSQLSSATRNYPGPSSEKVSLKRQVYNFTEPNNKTVFCENSKIYIRYLCVYRELASYTGVLLGYADNVIPFNLQNPAISIIEYGGRLG